MCVACISMVAAFSQAAMPAVAKLELPRIFGDGMIIQRDKPVNVWGWGDRGESIVVEFGEQVVETTADGDGNWTLALEPMSMNSKPQELKVKGKTSTLVFNNVVVGDVWLCSGQSNMEAAAGGIVDSDLDMPRANHPNIRCMTIPLKSSPVPLKNFPVEERNPYYVELKGVWRVTTPATARSFPAVGYHFARIVHETTGVPIGLIDNSWGGSVVETWVSRETLSEIPEAVKLIEYFDNEAANYDPEAALAHKMGNWKRHAEKVKAAGGKEPPKPTVPKTYTYRQSFPGGCFNALIAPIQKFSIAGVLFYQGMNNTVGGQARPSLYMDTYSALVPDWRKAFGDPDLPFGIIQMTSFGVPADENEPEITMLSKAAGIREAQARAHFQHKNTGLVCTYDLGHIQMHSPFKRPIGERAARWALADVYKVKGIKYALPAYESCKKEGNRMILTFAKSTYPSSPYGQRVEPKGFVIAGKDRRFYQATIERLKNGTFAASSEFVDDPASVRYAWGVHPIGNFGNRTGPTPPFRTDDWPAWSDKPIKKGGPVTRSEGVPTLEDAKAWAWERKAAQARKVLEQYEQRNKPKK